MSKICPKDATPEVSLNEIWAQYESNIRNMLRARVSNEADADDLVQEVSIRFLRGLDRLRSDESMRAWLYRISRNVVIDYYRKTRHGFVPETEFEEPLPEKEHRRVSNELSQCVEPFVRQLPPEVQEIIRAIDLEGIPQKEYAEAHLINYSTLKSRIQRGRQMLRGLFEECCEFSRDCRGNLSSYRQWTDDEKKME